MDEAERCHALAILDDGRAGRRGRAARAAGADRRDRARGRRRRRSARARAALAGVPRCWSVAQLGTRLHALVDPKRAGSRRGRARGAVAAAGVEAQVEVARGRASRTCSWPRPRERGAQPHERRGDRRASSRSRARRSASCSRDRLTFGMIVGLPGDAAAAVRLRDQPGRAPPARGGGGSRRHPARAPGSWRTPRPRRWWKWSRARAARSSSRRCCARARSPWASSSRPISSARVERGDAPPRSCSWTAATRSCSRRRAGSPSCPCARRARADGARGRATRSRCAPTTTPSAARRCRSCRA